MKKMIEERYKILIFVDVLIFFVSKKLIPPKKTEPYPINFNLKNAIE